MIIDCYGSSIIGQRKSNQDSIACHLTDNKQAALIAVADGMGGYKGGDIASQLAIESIEQKPLELLQLDTAASISELDQALLSSAQQANERIHQRRSEEPRHAKMGTTLTAALFQDAQLSLVHIGDSRCYRFRQGELQQLTEDHNLAQQMVKDKTLQASELKSHPYSHILTRALGVSEEVEISQQLFDVQAGDSYLICSDGFFQVLEDEDITAELDKQAGLEKTVKNLLDQCTEKETSDNASLVLARVED
ncbi:MAG: protein phosphatase 2C domain-containing protein [Halieaceae bacterium]